MCFSGEWCSLQKTPPHRHGPIFDTIQTFREQPSWAHRFFFGLVGLRGLVVGRWSGVVGAGVGRVVVAVVAVAGWGVVAGGGVVAGVVAVVVVGGVNGIGGGVESIGEV